MVTKGLWLMLKNLYQAEARYSKGCYPCTNIFFFQNCRKIHLALLLHTFIYTAFKLNAFYTFVLLLYFIAFIQFITFCVLSLLNSALMLYRYFSSVCRGSSDPKDFTWVNLYNWSDNNHLETHRQISPQRCIVFQLVVLVFIALRLVQSPWSMLF